MNSLVDFTIYIVLKYRSNNSCTWAGY